MDFLNDIALIGTVPAIFIYVVAALLTLAVGVLTLRRTSDGSRLGGIIAVCVGGFFTALGWAYFFVWPQPYPGLVPWQIFVAGFSALVALLGIFTVKGRRLWLAILMLLSGGNTYLVANLTYEEYASVGSFFPQNNTVSMSYEQFLVRKTPPSNGSRPVGALVSIPFHGAESGLKARDAVAYIPPSYWTKPELKLPVIVLLHGNPGSPQRWFAVGDAAVPADRYQREHHGVSPILVSVDATGSWTGDPACVDGPELKMQTYLAHDVPRLIKEKLRVDTDQNKWTIAGLSYGGTCAMQVLANDPQSYGGFLNLSGYEEPALGSRKETVDTFFHGNVQAFLAINPKDIFENAIKQQDPRFNGKKAIFVTGDSDVRARTAQRLLSRLAQQAGMQVDSRVIPGNHGYATWRKGFREAFSDLAQWGGLES